MKTNLSFSIPAKKKNPFLKSKAEAEERKRVRHPFPLAGANTFLIAAVVTLNTCRIDSCIAAVLRGNALSCRPAAATNKQRC